MPVRHDDDN
jgi:hypothetical protein